MVETKVGLLAVIREDVTSCMLKQGEFVCWWSCRLVGIRTADGMNMMMIGSGCKFNRIRACSLMMFL